MIKNECEKSELWDFNRDSIDLTEKNEWNKPGLQWMGSCLKTSGVMVAKPVPAPGTGLSQRPSRRLYTIPGTIY